ncbi:LysR substrate-binding domain-containing protein [Iodobacter arcticus]|uniref:LysR substrate-binding domain-containing protein n=1 Tax=Iodobacter arcticus TaxID=590593 RepID=A0ABW2QTW9_9NEIS
MDKLTAMQVFTRVVDAGSFVKAANQLDISTSAVSRLVAELEAHLNTRLLQRSTRKLSLTEAGRLYHARCLQILGDVVEAESELGQEGQRPFGLLRINVPVSFGQLHLSPLIAAYQKAHPDVIVEIELSDRSVDLVEEGFDLALRISGQITDTLVARRLATIRIVTAAAPSYLAQHGRPLTPADLANHNCLIYTNGSRRGEWDFSGADGNITIKVAGHFRANNGDLLRRAALAGEGIICEPSFLIGEDLASGALEILLPDCTTPQLALYAVYPSRRHLSAKIRSFIDFLPAQMSEPPAWDGWMKNSTQPKS